MASTPAAKGSIPQQINGPRRSMLSGVLIGIGVAGFIDEAVFHQLLHWHHFYDLSTPSWGLISDGLFHAASWFCMVSGLFLFADLRRRDAWLALRHWAGFCLGLGGFQLYDGLVQHKWWHIHEIRYHGKNWRSGSGSGACPSAMTPRCLGAQVITWLPAAVGVADDR